MQLQTIETGFFKLDGGAMFGVVPKPLWNQVNPADERNRCTWAMRCLLVEAGDRLMLVDTGIGTKQDAKFFGHYHLHGEASLSQSIRQAGYTESDITDVLLTHLHFDHVGGAVQYNKDRTQLELTFPNATYWSHRKHWQWAVAPNPREKASFLGENILPIADSGQLRFVDEAPLPYPAVELLFVDGHTEKMILPLFRLGNQTLLYAADLIPSAAHLALPWIMSYDVRPLLTMEEKSRVLQRAADENWLLLFEHDPVVEAATVEKGEKGFVIGRKGRLADFR